MSEENVEIVRSIYEAFNRGDWDAMFATSAPDTELITPPGIRAGPYRGREEIQGYFEEWLAAFDQWSVLPEEFAESRDQVVAVLRIRAQPKGSNAEIDIRIGQVWTLRAGKTLSSRMFPKPAEALEAAGLSE